MFDTKNPDYHDIFDERGALYHQAMSEFPQARRLEFELAVAHCKVQAGHTLIDVPSGGGYLSTYLPEHTHAICMESSTVFAQLCERRGLEVKQFDKDLSQLDTQCADRILSLAGLHHVNDKNLLFREMHRILNSNGLACIVDVEEDSPVALFLDDIADRYTDTGHTGVYLNKGTADELKAAGFEAVAGQLLDCPWQFDTEADMAYFCRLLFGMVHATQEQVFEGIQRHLGLHRHKAGISMNWQLRCFTAVK